VADLHENYPEGVREWRKMRMPLAKKMYDYIMTPGRYHRNAKRVLPQMNEVVTVVDEARDLYLREYGLDPNRTTVVMNAEDVSAYDSYSIDEAIVAKYRGKFVLSYVGGFGRHRGLDSCIRAMPAIRAAIPEAILLLVGGKSSDQDVRAMMDLCKELGVQDCVEFTGWVDYGKVPSYIKAGSLCLIPHLVSPHTNSTIPHKLFQYMAMQKPVVATDCTPIKRIVEETQSGVIFPSNDHEALAKAVIALHADPERMAELGRNGRAAVETRYNLTNELRKLEQVYQRLK